MMSISIRIAVCLLGFLAVDTGLAQNEPISDSAIADAGTPNGAPPDKAKFHLFVLAGQSNMAGRGKLDPQAGQSNPRVLMLGKDRQWEPATDPLHFDKPNVVGVGLARTFADDYAARHPDVTVGLIPCAVGGSSIAAWRPGGYHSQTKTHPYDDAIPRIQAAMEAGVLKGVLWHQGESDSSVNKCHVYEQELHALIARFRRTLDSQQLPFVAGQLGQFSERPWNEHRAVVDAAHRRLPASVSFTALARSDGLTHKGDKTHFATASYRELGHRYFKAFESITTDQPLGFEIERTVAHQGFDGKRCWVHARAGVIPADSPEASPIAVMTTQPLQLSGSDVFYALNETRTIDGGESWSDLRKLDSFARRTTDDGREFTVCDFTPKWHTASRTLLGTGQTVWYQGDHVMRVRPRATAYAAYDPGAGEWSDWKRLQMPDESKFQSAGAGSVQRHDLFGGDLLLPIYFKESSQTQYSTTVCRCSFDGQEMRYLTHGDELTVDVKRGLYEPSITRFQGRYYLTMRNDDAGYVSVSDDGLKYGQVVRWKFDDGTDLGNYNTQQHWVTHSDALYLVYTRRGADNDRVFRHRAPLFIAQVDPAKLEVIRSTERILVPEKGARLGNFGVVDVDENESWVTVTEWMQPLGVEKHGSDNRIFVVKLKWSRPNRLVP